MAKKSAQAGGDVCPSCGQRIVAKQTLEIDENANSITRSGKTVSLSAMQVDIVYSLYKVSPSVISMEDLVEWVYAGDDPPPAAVNSIRQAIRKLRGKLAELKLEITSVHGAGYRLDFEGD